MRIPVLLIIVLLSNVCFGQKKKTNQITLPKIEVVDTPSIEWISLPKDTTEVGSNIQTVTLKVRSRLPLEHLELNVNGITSDVYTKNDLAPAVGENKYEQPVERTLTLRTGSNTISLIAQNAKGIRKESSKRIIVDPSRITELRNEKDNAGPMIYVSSPSNMRNERAIIFQETVKITGTVIDESGVQTLTINNIVTPIKTNGAFVINLPLNMGETQVNIQAKDVNQNITLKKFTIERRNTDGSEYSPADAKNYLLVVGINEYTSWPALFNAVSDAKAVNQILTTRYTFDSTNVTMLLNEQATRSNIYEAMRSYIEKISPQDNLVIYFSGHGHFDKLLNEGYWVPVDAHKEDVSAYIANSQLLKIIENINSQHTFLVADACFSGSLFAANTRGYSDHVEKYKSRWGLASGRLEFVSDGQAGQNSPFAQSFINFLSTNAEPKVAVSDLIQYVKKKVAEVNEQTPVGNPLLGVGDEGGEYVFYLKK